MTANSANIWRLLPAQRNCRVTETAAREYKELGVQ